MSWVTPRAFRGAPGFSTADAHYRIHSTIKRKVRGFVVQDLNGVFDHLSLEVVLPILKRLGAPKCLLHILTSVYANAERLFVSRGFASKSWVPVTRGLVQGDPLSPPPGVDGRPPVVCIRLERTGLGPHAHRRPPFVD